MYCATFYTHYANTAMTGTARLQVTTLRVPLPLPATPPTTCNVNEYVVMSQAEFLDRTADPFNLSLNEAGAIGSAVILLWAAAWGVRQLIRTTRNTDHVEPL